MSARHILATVLLSIAAAGCLVIITSPPKMCTIRLPAARAHINTFMVALEAYRADTGRYPSTSEGLQALRFKPLSASNWHGPYLPNDIPLDPWGRPYIYMCPGEHGPGPDIVSYGADGKPGGTGRGADTASWKSP